VTVPDNRDAILLETVRTHRVRLLAAFVFGQLAERRVANDNLKRLVGSIVVAAVACAGCVGFALVTSVLAGQAAAKQAQAGAGPATGAPFAADTFDRTVATGWGAAELGGRWTTVGAATDYAVAGGAASLRLTGRESRGGYLGSRLSDRSDTTVTLQRTSGYADGIVFAAVIGRRVSSSQDYRATVRLAPEGSLAVSLSRRNPPTQPEERSETALSDTVILLGSGAGSADQPPGPVTVRLQVVGTAPTVVRAKVWTGSSEPEAWTVQATDSTAGLQRPGAVGLSAARSAASTRPASLAVLDVVARPAP
jgi:hypothetical protein